MERVEELPSLTILQELTAMCAFTLAVFGSLAALIPVLLYGLMYADLFSIGAVPVNLDLLEGPGFWLFVPLFFMFLLSFAMGVHNAIIAWRWHQFIAGRWRRYSVNSVIALAPLIVSNLSRVFI